VPLIGARAHARRYCGLGGLLKKHDLEDRAPCDIEGKTHSRGTRIFFSGRVPRMGTVKPKQKPWAYKPRYGIIVVCKDEADQIRKFEQLKKRGLKLRVVVV
jgi:hypothetical protein